MGYASGTKNLRREAAIEIHKRKTRIYTDRNRSCRTVRCDVDRFISTLDGVFAMLDAMLDVDQQSAFDISSLCETPVMMYNAVRLLFRRLPTDVCGQNPFVENVPLSAIAPGNASQVMDFYSGLGDWKFVQGEETKAPKRLKNGCLEWRDAETGFRTVMAGERSYGLLTPLDELAETPEENWNPSDAYPLELSPMDDAELPSIASDVANSETPEDDRECVFANKKMRLGENRHPEPSEGEDPFLARYQNFFVLNKEIIQKRNGQTGNCGNVEKVRVEMESLDDGYRWRKYGRKAVKGNAYPRSYFKCTFTNCMCRKQVEQNPKNPKMLLVTYEGRHIHPPPSMSQRTSKSSRR